MTQEKANCEMVLMGAVSLMGTVKATGRHFPDLVRAIPLPKPFVLC